MSMFAVPGVNWTMSGVEARRLRDAEKQRELDREKVSLLNAYQEAENKRHAMQVKEFTDQAAQDVRRLGLTNQGLQQQILGNTLGVENQVSSDPQYQSDVAESMRAKVRHALSNYNTDIALNPLKIEQAQEDIGKTKAQTVKIESDAAINKDKSALYHADAAHKKVKTLLAQTEVQDWKDNKTVRALNVETKEAVLSANLEATYLKDAINSIGKEVLPDMSPEEVAGAMSQATGGSSLYIAYDKNGYADGRAAFKRVPSLDREDVSTQVSEKIESLPNGPKKVALQRAFTEQDYGALIAAGVLLSTDVVYNARNAREAYDAFGGEALSTTSDRVSKAAAASAALTKKQLDIWTEQLSTAGQDTAVKQARQGVAAAMPGGNFAVDKNGALFKYNELGEADYNVSPQQKDDYNYMLWNVLGEAQTLWANKRTVNMPDLIGAKVKEYRATLERLKKEQVRKEAEAKAQAVVQANRIRKVHEEKQAKASAALKGKSATNWYPGSTADNRISIRQSLNAPTTYGR